MEAGESLKDFQIPSPEETETAEERRLYVVPTEESLGLVAPFVDLEAVMAEEPEVFDATYDDTTDQPYFRAMVKHFTDDEVMTKVDMDFGNKKVPRDAGSTVSDNTFSDFLSKADRYRLLTKKEEVTLARNMKLGVAAYKRMEATGDWGNRNLRGLARQGAYSYQAFFHANLRLVVGAVRSYRAAYKHIQDVDGLQYAYFGMQRAIEKFDETRGFKFSTYAGSWVSQALSRNVANSSRIIRLPVPVDTRWKAYTKKVDGLRAELGREPTLAEAQQATGVSDEDIKTFKTFGDRSMSSLNRSVNDKGTEFGDTVITDDPTERGVDALGASEKLRKIIDMANLTDVEKMVLSIRRGIMLPELEGTIWPGGAYEEIFDGMGVLRNHQAPNEDPEVSPRNLGTALGITINQVKRAEEWALESLQIAAEQLSIT